MRNLTHYHVQPCPTAEEIAKLTNSLQGYGLEVEEGLNLYESGALPMNTIYSFDCIILPHLRGNDCFSTR
jgi:hypothetical protein